MSSLGLEEQTSSLVHNSAIKTPTKNHLENSLNTRSTSAAVCPDLPIRSARASFPQPDRISCSFAPVLTAQSFKMSARIPLRLVGLAAAFAAASSAQNNSLDDYIATQRPVYLQSVLDNIGPDGVNVPGTNAGFVVASPSTDDPDCMLVPLLCSFCARTRCNGAASATC